MFSFAINRDRRRAARITVAATLAALIIGTGALPAAAASAPYLVKNIKAGSESSEPFELVALGDVVIFTASGGAVGRELWRSDGTSTGTYRVLDIRPGGKTSNPRGLVRIGDEIFFSANDGQHGQELWVTDGTAIGTHLVKEIVPGPVQGMAAGSIWPIAVDVDGVAFFTPNGDDRLWRSDGTEAGTFAVPGAPSNTSNLTAFGSRVYFGGEGKMWRSDGTLAGTKKVKNSSGSVMNEPREILAMDDLVFFQYRSSKLWRTDGTNAGTFNVLNLGSGCIYNCDPMGLTPVDDLVYFKPLNDPLNQLWRSDGTVDGTFPITPTYPELPAGMRVLYTFDVNGDTYYSALVDGDPQARLYSTDGTAAGTIQVGPPSPGWPMFLTVIGDQVLFRAQDLRGVELWAMNL